MRTARYIAIELTGGLILYVAALGYNTMEAGWICGAACAGWMVICGFVKRARA